MKKNTVSPVIVRHIPGTLRLDQWLFLIPLAALGVLFFELWTVVLPSKKGETVVSAYTWSGMENPLYSGVMQTKTMRLWHTIIVNAEKVLAGAVILGVIFYALASVQALMAMDWTQNEAFYQFIYRVLLLIIGLELARMLITHSIAAVLELLSFVIARKMLKPDLTSIDIILSVFAFVALTAARHYFMKGEDDSMMRDAKDKP